MVRLTRSARTGPPAGRDQPGGAPHSTSDSDAGGIAITHPLGGLRIGVIGKGGSGKSTLAALLGRALVRRGYDVQRVADGIAAAFRAKARDGTPAVDPVEVEVRT